MFVIIFKIYKKKINYEVIKTYKICILFSDK